MKNYKYQSGDATRKLTWGKLLFDVAVNPKKYLKSVKEVRKTIANPRERYNKFHYGNKD